jgi:hypothetical protein
MWYIMFTLKYEPSVILSFAPRWMMIIVKLMVMTKLSSKIVKVMVSLNVIITLSHIHKNLSAEDIGVGSGALLIVKFQSAFYC